MNKSTILFISSIVLVFLFIISGEAYLRLRVDATIDANRAKLTEPIPVSVCMKFTDEELKVVRQLGVTCPTSEKK